MTEQGGGSQEEFAELGRELEERQGFSPYHPNLVRYKLGWGLLIFVACVVLAEVAYSMAATATGCPSASQGAEPTGRSLQQILDDFALFDAPLFTLAGVVFTFYFTATHEQ